MKMECSDSHENMAIRMTEASSPTDRFAPAPQRSRGEPWNRTSPYLSLAMQEWQLKNSGAFMQSLTPLFEQG